MAEGQINQEINLPKVSFDKELKSYHVSSSSGLKIWLTDETWIRKKQMPWFQLRDKLEKETEQIDRNPFGESSIDPLVQSGKRKSRSMSINRSEILQELFPDLPLVIKGVGKNLERREDLIEQFQVMRHLFLAQEILPDDIKNIISFANVYGAISYPNEGENKQWLIMEQVPDAKEIEEVSVIDPKYPDIPHSAFNKDKYPELFRLVRRYCSAKDISIVDGNVRFRSLRKVFEKFGIDLKSLNGRDVLEHTILNGEKNYTIIDMRNMDLKQPIRVK